jgi:hypothetical protein
VEIGWRFVIVEGGLVVAIVCIVHALFEFFSRTKR